MQEDYCLLWIIPCFSLWYFSNVAPFQSFIRKFLCWFVTSYSHLFRSTIALHTVQKSKWTELLGPLFSQSLNRTEFESRAPRISAINSWHCELRFPPLSHICFSRSMFSFNYFFFVSAQRTLVETQKMSEDIFDLKSTVNYFDMSKNFDISRTTL